MVDVCLILEGTYPYVTGGVSSWVHQLISGLPGLSFSIVHISSSSGQYKEIKYTPPPNLLSIEEIFLHDYHTLDFGRKKEKKILREFDTKVLKTFKNWEYHYFKKHLTPLYSNAHELPDMHANVFSENTWNAMLSQYNENPDQSFLDYFWSWRFIHLPIFKLTEARLPKARVYHTVSTGYAGFLAAIAKIRYGAPVLLTEHGIYSKERKIEIQSADWIYRSSEVMSSHKERSFFQHWWIEMFNFMSTVCYDYADDIISLFNGNRLIQIAEGAQKEKTSCIPNGIVVGQYAKLKKQYLTRRTENPSFVIGFVGRVVPIKDVKTFIRAIKIIRKSIPEAKAVIYGPYNEDLEYYMECRQLVSMLELDNCIDFTGPANMMKEYPQIDILVLTSISEAQPLVLLEANTIGIPCVATNVGACRELLEGSSEDAHLGAGGLITDIANPEQTAQCCISILSNKELHNQMSNSGIKRVEANYRQDSVISQYYSLYTKLMG